jgi:hypothetical protein
VIIIADTATWLKVVASDESIYKAILLRRVRLAKDQQIKTLYIEPGSRFKGPGALEWDAAKPISVMKGIICPRKS